MGVASLTDGLSLLSARAAQYKHLIVATKYPETSNFEAAFEYTPPKNFTWVITKIALRSIPPVDDVALTPGDWRSFDYDAGGDTSCFIRVNGTPISDVSQFASYFIVLNRPCLFAFQGGDHVEIVFQHNIGTVPSTEEILLSVDSFLLPAKEMECLTKHATQIIAPTCLLPRDALTLGDGSPRVFAVDFENQITGAVHTTLPNTSTIVISSVADNFVDPLGSLVPAGPFNAFTNTGIIRGSTFFFTIQQGFLNPRQIAAVGISNPAAPVIASRFDLAVADAVGMDIEGSLAYVLCDGLKIVDVSNPAAMALISDTPLDTGLFPVDLDEPKLIAAENSIVYIVSTGGPNVFAAYDASNPLAVSQLGTLQLQVAPSVDESATLAIVGDLAFVAIDSTLRIIDKSNPASPVLVKALPIPNADNSFLDLAAAGQRVVLISDLHQTVTLIDVSNPAAPRFRGILSTRDFADSQPLLVKTDGRTVHLLGSPNSGGAALQEIITIRC